MKINYSLLNMNHLLRVKGVGIEQVKILIPEIIIECKDYLSRNIEPIEEFNYKMIKNSFLEDNGDLDSCKGHYQLQPRLGHSLGRLYFAYNDKDWTAKEPEFDVGVIQLENEKEIGEIMNKIKIIFKKEKIDYAKLPV